MGLCRNFFLSSLILVLACKLITTSEAQSVSNGGDGTVQVGAFLTATEDSSPWLSSSGDFAFGFHKLEGQPDLFLLSIWYNKIPDWTPVWYLDYDSSAGAGPSLRGTKVELTSDRGLVLTSPNQSGNLVVSNPIIGTVSHGILDNNGNFMVVNKDSETLWGSFNHSTDTILPGQTLPLSSAYLYSRKAKDNFSPGRFRLRLDQNGDLALRMINIPSSFRSEPYFTHQSVLNETSDIRGLNFNESGHLFISYGDHGKDLIFPQEEGNISVVGEGFYYRATLDFDGVFAVYRWRKAEPESEPTWEVVWQIPKDICLTTPTTSGSGVCGFNRICRLNVNSRPDCQCPIPFSVDDPDDDYRSCVPGFIQSCGNGIYFPSDYDFYTQINIDWPLSDYEELYPYSEETCKQDCLNDCMCAVAVHTDDNCWKKKMPLSNGRVAPSVNRRTFIKFSKKDNNSSSSHPDTLGRRNNNEALILLISLFLGGSGLVNVILFVAISISGFLIYKKKILPRALQLGDDISDKHLRCFTYRELEAATDGFKEEAGRGSFGIVYKGVLKTKTGDFDQIAVKKLDRIAQDIDLEFKTEVNVIGQTHHKNLVRLVGYCSEGENRLLVYEYLRNGSLAGFLFGELKLGWKQRVQIAIGIAKGLIYLHDECSVQIIHCDIKPQNILLDDDYNARISDFGLAKLLRIDQTGTHTGIRGTKGYVAPEWFRNMVITVKADVYSFGVQLLEIVCCRRSVEMKEEEEGKAILTYWVYDCYVEGKLDALVWNDSEAMSDLKKVKKFIMVGLWCIQEDPSLRPNMKLVVLMLEGIIEVTPPPNPSPFSTK